MTTDPVVVDPGVSEADGLAVTVVDLQIEGFDQLRGVVDNTTDDSYSTWVRNGAGLEGPVRWAAELVDPDSVVIDLGANLGTFAIPVASCCGRLLAVEANPRVAGLLAMAAGLNAPRSMMVLHAAVWDSVGTVALAGDSAWASVGGDAGLSVPTVTFEGLVSLFGPDGVDLVKVDIEGAEVQVLPAIGRYAATRDDFAVIYEANQFCMDTDLRVLHRSMAQAGLELHLIDPITRTLVHFDPEEIQFTLNCDILAVKGKRAAAIADQSVVLTLDQRVQRFEQELRHFMPEHRSYARWVLDLRDDEVRTHPTITKALAEERSNQEIEFDSRYAKILA